MCETIYQNDSPKYTLDKHQLLFYKIFEKKKKQVYVHF